MLTPEYFFQETTSQKKEDAAFLLERRAHDYYSGILWRKGLGKDP